MKAAVVFLVLLGLLAAVSAAVLVQTLSYKPPDGSTQKVIDEAEVMVASRDLAALTVVDASVVTKKTIKKTELPEHALTNSVQVVGKVLAVPMVEGEMFRPTVFAKEGSGVHMAAALPPGRRAMSISLADWSSMAGILYPGSVVDVLFSFKKGRGSSDAISITLLQGVQVLAIGSQSVTSSDQYQDRNPGAMSTKGQINQRMVTLMVDSKQAEILQLASQHGQISLTMRNPMDVTREGQRQTRASELLGGSVAPAQPSGLAALAAAIMRQEKDQETGATAAGAPAAAPRVRVRGMELWETLIIRGGVSETKTFPMPNGDGAAKSQTEPAQLSKDGSEAGVAAPSDQRRVVGAGF
jgi:pilus assembly protein CpaB